MGNHYKFLTILKHNFLIRFLLFLSINIVFHVSIYSQDFEKNQIDSLKQVLVKVDVKNIDVKIGDEVVIFVNQGNEKISVDEIANLSNTINYEIICKIGYNVPRVYIKNGKIYKINLFFMISVYLCYPFYPCSIITLLL